MKAYLRLFPVAVLCLGLLVSGILTACTQPAFANTEAITAAVDVTADVLGDTAVVDTVSSALSTGAVKFQEALAYLIGLVAAVAVSGWAWVSNKLFSAKGKIPLSVENKAAIDNAVEVGVNRARDYLQSKARGMPDWQVKSNAIAVGANFVLASAPTALSALGLTAVQVEGMIRDKLALDEPAPDFGDTADEDDA